MYFIRNDYVYSIEYDFKIMSHVCAISFHNFIDKKTLSANTKTYSVCAALPLQCTLLHEKLKLLPIAPT